MKTLVLNKGNNGQHGRTEGSLEDFEQRHINLLVDPNPSLGKDGLKHAHPKAARVAGPNFLADEHRRKCELRLGA